MKKSLLLIAALATLATTGCGMFGAKKEEGKAGDKKAEVKKTEKAADMESAD